MAAHRRRQQNSNPQKENAQTRTGKTFDLQPDLSSGTERFPALQNKSSTSRGDMFSPVL
jgi:hypothetical protein